jgi:hypothetical protein
MVRLLQSTYSALGEMWCQAMHSDAMWPVKGEYRCRTCLRSYPVAWEAEAKEPAASHAAGRRVQPITTARARVA